MCLFKKNKRQELFYYVITTKGKWLSFALNNGLTYQQFKDGWAVFNPEEPIDPRGETRKVFEDEEVRQPIVDCLKIFERTE